LLARIELLGDRAGFPVLFDDPVVVVLRRDAFKPELPPNYARPLVVGTDVQPP
jgi:hypothetical protein